MLGTPISVLGGWPTVSGRFVRQVFITTRTLPFFSAENVALHLPLEAGATQERHLAGTLRSAEAVCLTIECPPATASTIHLVCPGQGQRDAARNQDGGPGQGQRRVRHRTCRTRAKGRQCRSGRQHVAAATRAAAASQASI